MLQLSNPRREAVVEDYPLGFTQTAEAHFYVETVKGKSKGDRIVRTTTNNGRTSKPKRTTYHLRMVLVDGDDGKIYALGLTEYGQVVLWPSTFKTTKYFYEDTEEYGIYRAMLEAAA